MKRLLKKIYTPLAWTIFIQVLFCLPGNKLPEEHLMTIPGFDKMVHFIFMSGFVILWCYFLYKRQQSFRQLKINFFIIFLIAMANGIIVEYIQLYLIPYRSFDPRDIIADIIGAAVAYGLANILFLKERA